jgi:hypothetical protein
MRKQSPRPDFTAHGHLLRRLRASLRLLMAALCVLVAGLFLLAGRGDGVQELGRSSLLRIRLYSLDLPKPSDQRTTRYPSRTMFVYTATGDLGCIDEAEAHHARLSDSLRRHRGGTFYPLYEAPLKRVNQLLQSERTSVERTLSGSLYVISMYVYDCIDDAWGFWGGVSTARAEGCPVVVISRPFGAAVMLMVAAVCVVPTIWRFIVIRRRRNSNACVQCGYSLTGNTSGRCPECGRPVGPQRTSNAPHQDGSDAVADGLVRP